MAVCVRRNYPKERLFSIGLIFLLLGKTIVALAAKETPPDFTELGKHFEGSVFSLMQKYCLDCHSTKKQKGELDLERFATLLDVRKAPKVWVKVVEMMVDGVYGCVQEEDGILDGVASRVFGYKKKTELKNSFKNVLADLCIRAR